MQTLTDKDNKKIVELFNDMIVELNRIADDIKQSGADAYMIDEFDKSDALKASAITLKDFSKEVADLSTRWKKGIFSLPSHEIRPATTNHNHYGDSRGRKRSRTHLKVTFTSNNLLVYSKASAIDTFVEALKYFRLEDVAKLDIQTGNYPLVTKSAVDKHPTLSTEHKDWYINFPNYTKGKQECLEYISKTLKIPIRVDVI